MRGTKKKDLTRVIAPDPKYGDETLAKFINFIMEGGKKTTTQGIVYRAFDKIKADSKKEPLQVFEEALKNVSPQVEVRSRRVGGANYQVPIPVTAKRQRALAFRWIVGAALGKKGKAMHEKLADIILESSQNLGDAIRKRDDVHRMAEANKAFAHFARFRK